MTEEFNIMADPIKPTNVVVTPNKPATTTNVEIIWTYGNLPNIQFKVIIDDVVRGIVNTAFILVNDLAFNTTHKVNIVAIDTLTEAESEPSDDIIFELKEPIGFSDPNHWLPIKIDNILVTYQK